MPNSNPNAIVSVFNGVIELTRGCLDVSTLGLTPILNTIIVSGLISFGGISINLQALTFLKKMHINLKFYFLQKITHTLISISIATILAITIF